MVDECTQWVSSVVWGTDILSLSTRKFPRALTIYHVECYVCEEERKKRAQNKSRDILTYHNNFTIWEILFFKYNSMFKPEIVVICNHFSWIWSWLVALVHFFLLLVGVEWIIFLVFGKKFSATRTQRFIWMQWKQSELCGRGSIMFCANCNCGPICMLDDN